MKLSDKYRAAADDWALVTGAASGIGRAFAERLGSMGYNLVLADIDGAGLQTTATDLGSRHGVDVRTLRIDLSQPAAATELHDFCSREGTEPLIVINNAGIFSYNDILATDLVRIETMVGLHVLSVSLICRMFGATMAATAATAATGRNNGGYILNVSSYSAWMPWPGIAVYSATKSYIRNFSLAFAAEMREKGVVVTTVLPAGVTTELYGLSPRLQNLGRRLGILLTPERTVELALAAMFRGRRQYVPGFLMRLVLPIVRSLPAWAVRIARRMTLRFQKSQ